MTLQHYRTLRRTVELSKKKVNGRRTEKIFLPKKNTGSIRGLKDEGKIILFVMLFVLNILI